MSIANNSTTSSNSSSNLRSDSEENHAHNPSDVHATRAGIPIGHVSSRDLVPSRLHAHVRETRYERAEVFRRGTLYSLRPGQLLGHSLDCSDLVFSGCPTF